MDQLKYIYQSIEEGSFQVPKCKAIAQVKTMSRISIGIKNELKLLLGRHRQPFNFLGYTIANQITIRISNKNNDKLYVEPVKYI